MSLRRAPRRLHGSDACDPYAGAVGWCVYPGCRRFAEPTETPACGRRFRCRTCRRTGWREAPRGTGTGRERPYREVRVLHAFRVLERRYARQAIVRDESLGPDHRAFALTAPWIDDADQALDLADALFAALEATDDERLATAVCLVSDVRLPWQATISLDAPREELRMQLARLAGCADVASRPAGLTIRARSG